MVHVDHKAGGAEDARFTAPLPWAPAAIVQPSRRAVTPPSSVPHSYRAEGHLLARCTGSSAPCPILRSSAARKSTGGWRWEESEHVTCGSPGQAPLARRPSQRHVLHGTRLICSGRPPRTPMASRQRSAGGARALIQRFHDERCHARCTLPWKECACVQG